MIVPPTIRLTKRVVGLIVRLTLMFWFKSKLPLESVTTPLEEMLPASVKGPVPTNTVVPPVVRLMSRASSAPRPWLFVLDLLAARNGRSRVYRQCSIAAPA